MKFRSLLVTLLVATGVTVGAAVCSHPVQAAREGRANAIDRTPKIDWATLPIGVASSITTLSADQTAKITAIETKLTSDVEAAKTSGGKPEVAAKIKALNEQAGADVKTLLGPDQIAAIEGYAPVFALLKTTVGFKPDALQQLSLTTDQLSKLKDIASDNDAKQKAIDDEARAKSTELKSASQTQAMALLTPEQTALLSEKRGPSPFGRAKHGKANK